MGDMIEVFGNCSSQCTSLDNDVCEGSRLPGEPDCAAPVILHYFTPVLPEFIPPVVIFFWSVRRYLFYWAMFVFITTFLPAWLPNKNRIRYFAVLLALIHLNLVGTVLFILLFFTLWWLPGWKVKFIWFMTAVFLKIVGVEIVFKDSHNLTDNGPGIVILNHMSILDTVSCSSNVHYFGSIRPVVKSSVRWYGPYAVVMWVLGAVFLDRSDKEAYKKLSQSAKIAFQRDKEEKVRLILYPEGTRNPALLDKDYSKNIMLPFKIGAFRLAKDHNVPVFPVVTSKYYFCEWPWRFERGFVVIKALPPFHVGAEEDLQEVASRTQEMMQKEFNVLSRETQRVGESNQSSGFWTGVTSAVGVFSVVYPLLVSFSIFEDVMCVNTSFDR